MYAKTVIVGNLGVEPTMRYTHDGTPVTSFSVAVNKSWTDSSGQKHDQTTWYRVTAWRRLAETCNEWLHKGSQVLVEGEMQESKPWQAKDGEWRSSLELRAWTVKFLGSRQELSESTVADVDEESIPF